MDSDETRSASTPGGRIPAEELSLLLAVSEALASSLELDIVLQTSIDCVVRLLGLESGAIYLLDGEELYLGAAYPPLPPKMPMEFRRASLVGHAYVERCLSERRPVLVVDTETAEFTPEERAVADARKLRSILYVPITTDSERIGTVIVGTQSRVHAFRDHDAALCRTLGYQIALAITNARLFEELRSSNKDLAEHRERLAELVLQRTEELERATERLARVTHERGSGGSD